jgi:hypothetical protein
MIKYKNVSGFRQVLIIGGKKVIVNDGDVFEKDSEFEEDGFVRVSDLEKVTVEGTYSRKSNFTPITTTLDLLNDKVKEVEKSVKNTDMEPILNSLKLNEDMIANLEKDFKKFESTCTKRLEILKKAINFIEKEMAQLYEKGILESKDQ